MVEICRTCPEPLALNKVQEVLVRQAVVHLGMAAEIEDYLLHENRLGAGFIQHMYPGPLLDSWFAELQGKTDQEVEEIEYHEAVASKLLGQVVTSCTAHCEPELLCPRVEFLRMNTTLSKRRQGDNQ